MTDELARLDGIKLVTSPLVPEGKILLFNSSALFHSRPSRRERWRRPHGRARNCPRRRRVEFTRYQPDYDRLVAMVENVG